MELKHAFKKTDRKTYLRLARKTRNLEELKNLVTPDKAKVAPNVPDGLFLKCPHCKATLFTKVLKKNAFICPKCQHHFSLYAWRRIDLIADSHSFMEWDAKMSFQNPIHFEKYAAKSEHAKIITNLNEAIITGEALIQGQRVVLGVMDQRFMMASMGKIVGEKLTRAIERATELKLPLILFICSGGARMQEGIFSLMQMAKTAAALKRHHKANLLYIPVLTNPTTGGVTASFAMLGDIILAEPGALIGFAGPRVIEQTIGQKLPDGFQRAEFLQEHGFIDQIISRELMKETLSQLLQMHRSLHYTSMPPEESKAVSFSYHTDLSPWNRVLLSRDKNRPTGLNYINSLFDHFIELHGDRSFGDDRAITGGLAFFNDFPVTVIAQTKGKTTKENLMHNFGMPSPEGYRKALRLAKQAEKFNRPIILFVDTPGAFCGLGAEERGQGEAIASCLFEFSDLQVPVLSIVVGEGGSGGALALAVADEVWMLENAVYSILSPEGFASILYKDSTLAEKAAESMKMTAQDLYRQHIIDKIIPEPKHFTLETFSFVTDALKKDINTFLMHHLTVSNKDRMVQRYERYRNF